jgi:hypothetical protein
MSNAGYILDGIHVTLENERIRHLKRMPDSKNEGSIFFRSGRAACPRRRSGETNVVACGYEQKLAKLLIVILFYKHPALTEAASSSIHDLRFRGRSGMDFSRWLQR